MLTLGVGLFLAAAPVQAQVAYPETPRGDAVDVYHGQSVGDPYRWLEDAASPATLAWVEKQNALTESLLDPALRRQWAARLAELWNYPRYGNPFREAGKTYYFKNDGLQNQSVLYEDDRVVLDPNTMSVDGTTALNEVEVSRDGRWLGYSVSVHGSDQQEIRVRELSTLRDLEDRIQFCKFSPIAWTHDSQGFYYSRFPDPAVTPAADHNNYSKVYYHRLGTPQSQDVLVYEDPANKELGFDPAVSDDGRYLIIRAWRGTDVKNRIFVQEIGGRAPLLKVLDRADAGYEYVGNDGRVFYFRTDLAAPRGRIVAIDLDDPQRGRWLEIIPQGADAIDFVSLVDGKFVVATLHDAAHQVKLFDKQGHPAGSLKLPALGAVTGLSGKPDDREMFLSYVSYVAPTTIYRYDFARGELSEFRRTELDFPASDYAAEVTFARSKDGTRVPIHLVYKRGMQRDGSHPTWLYGYGGFNVNMVPRFSVSRLAWLERGGILATAVLRGGGEYGEQWHKAGQLARKQNVFDDFIASAQHLVHEGWTQPARLAINGGSNGGLLVAACETQRPDLFGAVVCQVPVIDMLRYHKFTVGRYWIPEYGSAEHPEQFQTLLAYSPLHRVKPGTAYPATLITTADTDDRVVPMHAKKFAAALQAAQAGPEPILLRVETKAGHGAGKPTSKQIEEAADILTFMWQYLR